MNAPAFNPALGTTEACTDGLIVRQASVAGGLGACYAPNGEREGQSRLANITLRERNGARGAKPPRKHHTLGAKRSARGGAASQSPHFGCERESERGREGRSRL